MENWVCRRVLRFEVQYLVLWGQNLSKTSLVCKNIKKKLNKNKEVKIFGRFVLINTNCVQKKKIVIQNYSYFKLKYVKKKNHAVQQYSENWVLGQRLRLPWYVFASKGYKTNRRKKNGIQKGKTKCWWKIKRISY